MRSLCRSNPLRLAVLLWFAGWLVLVMPGHTRGVVKLPGAEVAANADCCTPEPACCVNTTPCDDPVRCDPPTPGKPSDPAKHCAICFLKAHLTDPPPVTLYTPFLGELDALTYACETSIADGLAAPDGVRGRGPPC